MRLFKRKVPLGPIAAVLVCPAGIGAWLTGGAARRNAGGFEGVFIAIYFVALCAYFNCAQETIIEQH
jgi:hypothetical protein